MKTADGWRDVLHGPGLLLYMNDQNGKMYTSLGTCPQPRVIIEEEGPLRICVLITGHLRSEVGVLFSPYKLRIHLYAGKADLRIFHTFIYDQDPTLIELAGIGLKVFLSPGDEAEVEGEVFGVSCNMDQMFLPAMRLFPSKVLHDFILERAKYGHDLGQAYELTGDLEKG